MSVRVAERNKSPIEYIDKARQIVDIVNSRMGHFLDKISKKYDRYKYIANRIYGYYYECSTKYALEPYICVCYANRIKIKDDASYQRRTNQLNSAIEYYNKLINVLSVIFKSFQSSFNMNAIANLTDLINTEVKEIKNILQSDKDRLKSLAG